MIVDDEPMIKKSLTKIIDSSGEFIVCGEAEDGKEALELVQRLNPHLLFTDIYMPVMDGMELIEAVRVSGYQTEIVVLSGFAEFDYAKRMLPHRIAEYLLKPVNPYDVMRLLTWLADTFKTREVKEAFNETWLWRCRTDGRRIAEKLWRLDESGYLQLLGEICADMNKLALTGAEYKTYGEQLLAVIAGELAEISGGNNKRPAISLRLSAVQNEELQAEMKQNLVRAAEELRNLRKWNQQYSIRQAISYMDNHYSDPELSLERTAEAARISPSYLSRFFKETTGVTFIHYLSRLRLEKAAEMLRTTLLKTHEIAALAGYMDYPHFSKTFKKMYGVSPVEYRKL
ncbi:response regulator (plasmid) [Paenibacillus rhizovicinus]|uniref:Response regulator n=1 Tax=Paenibacillus rhizovicinus TaxID=2704463 RepID=A0A6C0PCD1_9BACL|nr:response regulator [Paenibacillus rhizovicinus]QHW35503.1 response regulator [Paenibacillus rhizovicinus]